MPRRLKLHTVELGSVELLLVYSYNGVWEAEWAPFQGDPIAALFTVATKEMMDHALHGWTSPFIKALGLAPAGALRKLPAKARLCVDLSRCPQHDEDQCLPTAKKMPWCFTPGGVYDDAARLLANEVIQMWREGVYIVVVEESRDG